MFKGENEQGGVHLLQETEQEIIDRLFSPSILSPNPIMLNYNPSPMKPSPITLHT